MTKYSGNYFVKAAATVLLFCLSIHCIHAENKEIDSLKNLLPGAAALEEMKVTYLLGSKFFDSFPDSALHYYNEGLKLSQKMHNDTFTAKCLNKIGILKYNSGDYEKAIMNFYSALQLFERYEDKIRAVRCLQYLGMAYNEQGMYDKALDFAKQSLDIAKAIDDKYAAAVSMGNIGSVYYSQSDYDNALKYFQQALQISEKIENRLGIADALNNVAVIYEKKKDFSKALEVHLRSLAIAKELGDSRGIAASYHNIGRAYKGMEKFPLASQYLDSSIVLAKEGDDKFYLKECYNTLSEVCSDMGNFEKAYQTHLLFSQLNDTLMSEENKKQFAEMNTKYETEKKDNQITVLNKDSEKQKIIRNSFIGGFAFVLVFAGIFFTQRNKIKKGKQRSDELLLNILPSETAEELKVTGAARAKSYDMVTVMFTDFKNFSKVSERMSADELVREIHHCYSEFDHIIHKHGIEKIKTIGDSYMCAGGLPVSNNTNPADTVAAALDIQKFMLRFNEDNAKHRRPAFEIRIGIHTGPVVAGIVGIKKFAYDIWGDTVNIASRMESSGEAGKINISGATYELVKDKFNCTHRGKIQAKNKGEIDMYFVEKGLIQA
jgi:adenylate cyclase